MSIIRLVPDAKQYLESHPGFVFTRLTKDGANVKVKDTWSHKGVNSLSNAERDNIAVRDLLKYTLSKFLSAWNNDFDNPPIKVAGVEYVETTGPWSDTEGGSPENGFESEYRCGGTSVGFVLIKPL